MKLWDQYLELLKPAGSVIDKTWAPDDPAIQAALCRQLAMNLSQGYFLLCQSDANHPDWAPFENSVFLLQPNPDAVYYYAPVLGDGIYRIVGERGTAPVVGFATGKVMVGMGDPPGPGYNNYDANDLTLASDGGFEVIFSEKRPEGYAGDWWYLHPQASFILVRQFSYDWGRDTDLRMAIERLDSPPLKPRLTAEDIDRQLRTLFGGFTGHYSRTRLDFFETIRNKGPVNEMRLTTFSELGNGKEFPQAYFECVYELQPGEALILETELPEVRPYWNVQVIDGLWNQVEIVYRQSSLNGHQAVIDADGKFRAVLSLDDPDIHNWLDTGGNMFGMLIGRWYRCSSHPTPTLKKVPFAKLDKHLPPEVLRVTSGDRQEQLRQRRIGAQLRRRW